MNWMQHTYREIEKKDRGAHTIPLQKGMRCDPYATERKRETESKKGY